MARYHCAGVAISCLSTSAVSPSHSSTGFRADDGPRGESSNSCDTGIWLAKVRNAPKLGSHRARMVRQWVKFVLEGNSEAAAQLIGDSSEFPVAVTRNLAEARAWLRARGSDGAHYSGCSGLWASSGALRLRAHGIELPSGYPYDEWFLRGSHDIRSSSSREVAATEACKQPYQTPTAWWLRSGDDRAVA